MMAGISTVGLFPASLLNIPGIDHPNFHCGRQNMKHWLPVHSGTFHRNDRATSLCEPLGQLGQPLHRCGKLMALRADSAVGCYTAQARRNTSLMNIQTATHRINRFHGLPPCGKMGVVVSQRRQPGADSLFLHAIHIRLIEVPGPGQTDSGAGSKPLMTSSSVRRCQPPLNPVDYRRQQSFIQRGATRCMKDSGESRNPGSARFSGPRLSPG